MDQYSKNIHNKSSEIARELINFLLEDKETFVPMVTESNEEKAALQEKTLDAANKVLQFMATQDIPAQYATLSIDKLIDALSGLKSFVDKTVSLYKDEYISRSLGVKNEDGKYRSEVASISQIVLKLEEVRQATGNVKEDFFNEVAPKFPTTPAVESPYIGEESK